MSNEMIPADLAGAPSTLFRQQNVQTDRLGDGIDGSGFPIIGVSGKEFYLRFKGKRYTLVIPPSNPPSPADGGAAGYFDFIILRKGARRSHTYYMKGYQKGMDDRPTCTSTDGIAPDDSVAPYNPETKEGRQADLCELCPQHEWKKQPNGRDGRACADSLRLSILPMPSQMIALLGEPITEACLLRIPAASLTALSELGDLMVKRFGENTPWCSYIIRATFKKGVEWPQFEYRVVRFLSDTETAAILELRETPQAYRIQGLTPEGKSLVRRENVNYAPGLTKPHTDPLLVQQQMRAEPTVDRIMAEQNQNAIADRLAAERAARIAAARGQQPPEVLDLKAEVIEPQVPIDDIPAPPPASTPVPETADAIDAVIAAMRPRPPGA